jgi:hypothetical protein
MENETETGCLLVERTAPDCTNLFNRKDAKAQSFLNRKEHKGVTRGNGGNGDQISPLFPSLSFVNFAFSPPTYGFRPGGARLLTSHHFSI